MMGLLSCFSSQWSAGQSESNSPQCNVVHCYAHDWIWCCHRGPNACLSAEFFLHHSLGFATFFTKSQRGRLFWSLQAAQGCPETLYSMEFHITDSEHCGKQLWCLLQTFDNIIADTTMDDDTLDCAKGFVRKLEDFEFVFMLYTYEQIFSETDVVFDIVQQRAMDVLYCKKELSLFLHLSKRRGQRGLSKLFMPKQQISHQTQEMSPWESAVWPNCRIPKSATEICTWPSLITSWSRFLDVFQIWKVCFS